LLSEQVEVCADLHLRPYYGDSALHVVVLTLLTSKSEQETFYAAFTKLLEQEREIIEDHEGGVHAV
jgi:hypothetical protein